MKIFQFILGALVLLLAGGFGYFAFSDIPIEQNTVTKTIPNDRFFGEN